MEEHPLPYHQRVERNTKNIQGNRQLKKKRVTDLSPIASGRDERIRCPLRGRWSENRIASRPKKFFQVPKSLENFFCEWPTASLDTIRISDCGIDTQPAGRLRFTTSYFGDRAENRREELS